MKNKLIEVWNKIKLPLFILILILGTWGYTTAYWLFTPIKAEANQVWRDYQTRQSNKGGESSILDTSTSDGDSVEGVADPKTESHAQPEEGAEVNTTALPPSEISKIVDKVYILESSTGKNDGCRLKGLYNGYGWRQNSLEHRCYKSQEEVREEVEAWFAEKTQTKTIAESLCGYNLGFNSLYLQDCMNQSKEHPYYKNYLSLN